MEYLTFVAATGDSEESSTIKKYLIVKVLWLKVRHGWYQQMLRNQRILENPRKSGLVCKYYQKN